MLRTNLIAVCIVVAGNLGIEVARADVAFTTLGAGGTYDSSAAGKEVNGQNASGTLYAANAFQPLFDGNLTSIDLGITNYDIPDGGSGAIVLHLYANDTGTNTPVNRDDGNRVDQLCANDLHLLRAGITTRSHSHLLDRARAGIGEYDS
jgi:hypothetical protein